MTSCVRDFPEVRTVWGNILGDAKLVSMTSVGLGRVQADSGGMAAVALALVTVLAAASFSLSFLGLIQAAEWAGVPGPLRWLVPIVIDSTILVYAIAAAVQHSRGESTALSWLAVCFFTAVSVMANAAHVLAPGGVPVELSGTVIFGAIIAAIMPIGLFFATHTTVSLVVVSATGSKQTRQRRAAKRLAGPAPAVATAPAVVRPKVDATMVKELQAAGLSQRDIATKLGVSKTTVGRLLAGAETPAMQQA